MPMFSRFVLIADTANRNYYAEDYQCDFDTIIVGFSEFNNQSLINWLLAYIHLLNQLISI